MVALVLDGQELKAEDVRKAPWKAKRSGTMTDLQVRHKGQWRRVKIGSVTNGGLAVNYVQFKGRPLVLSFRFTKKEQEASMRYVATRFMAEMAKVPFPTVPVIVTPGKYFEFPYVPAEEGQS